MTDFETQPDRYKHWKLTFDGALATLALRVQQDQPLRPGYELKLNSYDLGVDVELADAVQRIRFEHPEVKVVIVTSGHERVFSSGANIPMLGTSSHAFKVNFCKFTNETRLAIEDASRGSGIKWIAALNGIAAGGGYELALACDEIYLVDDGNSTVGLPEVPLLGVLPGTGGLTRLVDKRMVRRDLADAFCTLAEGIKGKKAKAWGLVDDTWPKSKFQEAVLARARALAATLPDKTGRGIPLGPLQSRPTETGFAYEFVEVALDEASRTATLTVRGPTSPQPRGPDEYRRAGDTAWIVRFCRELDDALCKLRFDHESIGVVLLHSQGDLDAILAVERDLVAHQSDWLVGEILLYAARVLRRYELTARSLFALAGEGSAFGGLFLELALASDRLYMLDDDAVEVAIGPLSGGLLPMSNGLTRLQSRFLKEPQRAMRLAQEMPRLAGEAAHEAGLVTVLADRIDWDDEVRIAIEERVSLSPDALTGMEASLRFGGAETCDSKIFGRLSAWQNWIFTRPNATGPEGALTRYGQPEPAHFDWRRT